MVSTDDVAALMTLQPGWAVSVSINSSGLANRFNGTKIQWINDSKNVEIRPLRAFFLGSRVKIPLVKG